MVKKEKWKKRNDSGIALNRPTWQAELSADVKHIFLKKLNA